MSPWFRNTLMIHLLSYVLRAYLRVQWSKCTEFKMYFRTHLLWGLYMFFEVQTQLKLSFLVKCRLNKAAKVHGNNYFTMGVD